MKHIAELQIHIIRGYFELGASLGKCYFISLIIADFASCTLAVHVIIYNIRIAPEHKRNQAQSCRQTDGGRKQLFLFSALIRHIEKQNSAEDKNPHSIGKNPVRSE